MSLAVSRSTRPDEHDDDPDDQAVDERAIHREAEVEDAVPKDRIPEGHGERTPERRDDGDQIHLVRERNEGIDGVERGRRETDTTMPAMTHAMRRRPSPLASR